MCKVLGSILPRTKKKKEKEEEGGREGKGDEE